MGTLGLTISEFVKRLRKLPLVKKAKVYSFLITFLPWKLKIYHLGMCYLKKTKKTKTCYLM